MCATTHDEVCVCVTTHDEVCVCVLPLMMRCVCVTTHDEVCVLPLMMRCEYTKAFIHVHVQAYVVEDNKQLILEGQLHVTLQTVGKEACSLPQKEVRTNARTNTHKDTKQWYQTWASWFPGGAVTD